MYTPAEVRASETVLTPTQKIYSTHAAGKDVFLLPELLSKIEAVLIDVRFAPPLQPIKWNKDYLKLLLKGKYRHVPTLGNRASEKDIDSRKPSIHNLALGIKIITELKINLLLFCACEKEASCHLPAICDELRKQNREIIEISNWNQSNTKIIRE